MLFYKNLKGRLIKYSYCPTLAILISALSPPLPSLFLTLIMQKYNIKKYLKTKFERKNAS